MEHPKAISWLCTHHLPQPRLSLPLQHYTKEQGAICTKLVKPKPKTGMKSAEEELAKGRGGWWERIRSGFWGRRWHGPTGGLIDLSLRLFSAGWLLNLQHLTLGDRIGQGEFGGR